MTEDYLLQYDPVRAFPAGYCVQVINEIHIYSGTCRYVGPIKEKQVSKEHFVGVELDTQMTSFAGTFGSRKVSLCSNRNFVKKCCSKRISIFQSNEICSVSD